MRQCRLFSSTFLMQESIVASKMKEAFMGDKGLSGVVRKAELEKVFEINNVKKVGLTCWIFVMCSCSLTL